MEISEDRKRTCMDESMGNGKKSKDIPYKGGSVFGSITIAWETQFKEGNAMWKVPRLIDFSLLLNT